MATDLEIKNAINDAVCCLVSTSAAYTDEQVNELSIQVTNQIEALGNITPEILAGLKALVDPDQDTEEYDARENIFSQLGKIFVEINTNKASISSLNTLVASVTQTIVSEVKRLEGLIDAVAKRVDGVELAVLENAEAVAANAAAVVASNARIAKNELFAVNLIAGLEGICAQASACLASHKAEKAAPQVAVDPATAMNASGDAAVL